MNSITERAEYDSVDETEYKGITQKYVPTIEKKGANFKYYIQECSLVQDIKLTLQNKYPVGKLDDIVIHFVHYRNFEEANFQPDVIHVHMLP